MSNDGRSATGIWKKGRDGDLTAGVTDHGVVTTTDPDTGEQITAYQVSFFLTVDGVEHGVSIASSPTFGPAHPAYDTMIRSGKMTVVERAERGL